jgi:altronate hydrolase
MKIIQIDPVDNVAVALTDIAKDEELNISGLSFRAVEDVARGHKIALRDITSGTEVIKYGNTIAKATSDISQGQ